MKFHVFGRSYKPTYTDTAEFFAQLEAYAKQQKIYVQKNSAPYDRLFTGEALHSVTTEHLTIRYYDRMQRSVVRTEMDKRREKNYYIQLNTTTASIADRPHFHAIKIQKYHHTYQIML